MSSKACWGAAVMLSDMMGTRQRNAKNVNGLLRLMLGWVQPSIPNALGESVAGGANRREE